MERVVNFFIERKLLVYLISILLVTAGFAAMTNLSRQVLPNVDMQQVNVETLYPAASARDVEINVTTPLEEKILEVDGINKIRSVSMENYSLILITLDPDAEDLEEVKSDLRRAIDQVTDLPAAVRERPNVYDIETSWIPVLILGLSSKILTEKALRKIAERMEKDIESIPNIAHVDKMGFREREIKVQVAPDKLKEYYLSLQDIVYAVKTRNVRLTGGSLESFTNEASVLTLAEFNKPQDVGEVIVRSNFEGRRIVINDVAAVIDDFETRHMQYRVNGIDSIGLRIHKKASADSLRVMNGVQKYLERIRPELPEDVVIQQVRDNTAVTKRRLKILGNNALIGFVLLLAILIMFLNLRVALWTALGIPISLAVGMMLHSWTGGTIDSVSVMVFILVLGMLVDDAIVVAENIHRYQEEGFSPTQAAIKGVVEVAAPITATVSTTIIAFLPLFALGGMLGLFIKMIPIIIMGTLAGSLLESFFILPSHLAAGGKKISKWEARGAIIDPLFKPAKRIYRRLLEKTLRRRWWVFLFGVVFLIVLSLFAGKHMRFILFPVDGAEEFFVHVETTVGSSYQATANTVIELEKIVSALPKNELNSYETWVGMDSTGVAGDSHGDNLALIYIVLHPYGKDRSRKATEVIDFLKKETAAVSGVESINFELASGGPPVGRPVELNLIGDNEGLQQAAMKDVLSYLRSLPGVLDPVSDLKYAKDEEVIHIDYAALARLGLTVAEVANTVRLAFEGDVVSTVRFHQEEVDIRVQLTQTSRQSIETLKRLIVRNQTGKLIPLKSFIRLERRPAWKSIHHYQGQRVITITADVNNDVTSSGKIKEKIFEKYANLTQTYPGIRMEATGESEESAEVQNNMMKAGVLAILGVYFILVLLLNSVFQPLIILFAIPFGVIGVLLAFWCQGMTMGFMALLGILGMSGVVVNDSLIILSFINHLSRDRKEADKTRHSTIADASQTRLRPVILTTLTTTAALIPTAYGIGGDDPFVVPMVMAMLWGIVFATTLTLFWVPNLFAMGQDMKAGMRFIFKEKTLPRTQAEFIEVQSQSEKKSVKKRVVKKAKKKAKN
jgi:multidrug efflux pump subunit AcrB